MKWFRLWVDILDDHKINQLTDYEFRAFIYLLACASEEDAINGRLTRTLPAINRRCRRRQDHFNRAVETFQKLGLITIDDNGYVTITKWNKRQFQSDKSYERVKKHREQQPVRNVSVTVNETPPDTDTDTDTDKPPIVPQKRGTTYTVEFLTFWKAYPKKIGKDAAWKKWKQLNGTRPALAALVSAIEKQAQSDQWQKEGGQYIPHPATWLNQGRWADEVETSEGDLDSWARKKQAEMEARGETV